MAGLLLCVVSAGIAEAGNVNADDRERAVQLARESKTDDALRILGPLADRNPDDLDLQADYLSVLYWAGKSDEAWGRRHVADAPGAPEYLYPTLGRLARELGAFQASTRYYATAIKSTPDDADLRAARVMAHVDAGQFTFAEQALRADERRLGQRSALLFARGYLAEGRGQFVEAATAYRNSFVMDSTNNDAFTHLIRALTQIGGVDRAKVLGEQRSELIALRDWWQVLSDRAAYQVRWGQVAVADPATRFDATDRAIASLQANIATANRNGVDWQPLKRLSEFDLVTAYRDRLLMDRAIELHESLVDQELELPRHSLIAAADAYLYQRAPETARELYQRVIDADARPQFEPYVGRFYADLESEQADRALAGIDELVAALPTQIEGPSGLLVGNDDRAYAELHAALGRAYVDDLPTAERRLSTLVARAPANSDFRAEYANVKRYRGHYLAALEEAEIGLADNPQHPALQTALANALVDIHDYARAEPLVHRLGQTYPNDLDVQRLQRRWRAAVGPEVNVYFSADDGAQLETGSSARTLRTRVYSKTLANHYRLFVDLGDKAATFDDSRAAYQSASVGAEYRRPVIVLDGGVGANRYGPNKDKDKSSGFATAEVQINDQTQVSAEVQTFDKDTPLRALQSDVTARSVTLAATRREDESNEVIASAKYMDFDDGNERVTAGVQWRRRWASRPKWQFNTRLAAGVGTNSLETPVAYFNPEEEREIKLTLHNRWLSHRLYEKSMSQVLAVDIGSYWQENFGSGTVAGARYEHHWEIKPEIELVYGIGHERRPYDGVKESETSVYGYLRWLTP